MISASRIKYIQSLRQKKYRDRHGVFVAEGDKIVQELAASSMRIDMVCGLEGWLEQNIHKLPEEVTCITITEKELSRLSNLKTPNQVIAVVKKPDPEVSTADMEEDLVLVLDTLQDPGNLGTIIRTADWFGIRTIYCSPDTADVYNPKVVQSTMGSFIRIRIVYTDLMRVLGRTRRNIYGAFLEGESLYDARPGFPAALVIGNESGGISAEVGAFVNRKVLIPRHQAEDGSGADAGTCIDFGNGTGINSGKSSGKDFVKGTGTGSGNDRSPEQGPGAGKGSENGPESLNAAVAAGIMMSWFRK
ncbi:MAG: TrmH family RNA methyltransferase [Bacteroidales bacterium]